MPSKPNPPKLVTIAVTTTITIVFWVFLTLYQVLTAKPDPSVDEKLLEPIIPEIDSASLQKVRDSIFFEEGEFEFVEPTTEPIEQPVEVESEQTEEPTGQPTEITNN